MASSMTQTPEQQMNSRLTTLRSKLKDLQSGVRLSAARDRVEDLSTLVNGLEPRIKELRQRGYAFGKSYEAQASSLAGQWQALRDGAVREIERQSPQLEAGLRPLENRLSLVQARASTPAAIQATVSQLETDVNTFADKVKAVESSIGGMYNSFSTAVSKLKIELDRLDWMLQQFAEATFRLLASEGAVMAVKATYSKDENTGKDDPQGILYLTDQRLFFEQKQEVATKKMLFITTQKEKVHQLLLEAPVELVDALQANKKGLFGHEDHLQITFKPGVAVPAAWFHLDGQDCSRWQGLIGQARGHEFDDDRAVPLDPELIKKASSAPGKCPNCGAPVTQVVLRGMDSIRCEYCQYVIRL